MEWWNGGVMELGGRGIKIWITIMIERGLETRIDAR